MPKPIRNANGQFDRKTEILAVAPNRTRPVAPHEATFDGRLATVGDRAIYNPDEAVRHSRKDAAAMLRDVSVSKPLEERIDATCLLEWHIEPEDKQDGRARYDAGWREARNHQSVVWVDPATQQWRSAKGSPDYHSQFEDVTGLLYAPVFLLADCCEPLAEFLFWTGTCSAVARRIGLEYSLQAEKRQAKAWTPTTAA